GTMSAPTASGALKADNLVINHMVLNDVHGDFAYYDSILRLTNLHFSQLDGNYDANLMYNTKTSFIRGQATVVNGDIAGLIKVADMPVQDITGKLNGQIDVSGTSDNPTVSMKGNISQGTFGGETIDPSDVDVRLEQGIVNINKLALKIGDGTLAAKGSYALHGPVALSVAAKQFPSKALMTVLGKNDFVVDAPIDFAADLSGTSDDLQADVSAQLGSGTANGISISGAFALFNIRRGMITVQQASASRDPYKISAKGTIPVSALSGGKTDESMDVDFQLSNTSLDILTFLTPYVTDADGQIQGAVKVSGTLADPQVTGDVTVKDGTIKFKDTVYPLNDINADLSFKGRSAVLSGSGTMDKKGKKDPGSVSISGNASWSGRSLDTYSLSADFANLNVDNPYYNGPLTGYINVTPGDGRPKIGGLIDINNATIDVPLSLSESSSTPDLDLDFTLSLGDKVRLYNSALYDLMVTGAVSFKGSLEHPNPSGRFEATRGSVHYLDTNFRVSKAIADFSRYDSLLPYIDAEGISRVGQYTVMLTLRGQADNMDLLLRSDPPLTKPQIVSLITLRNGSGRPQSSIGEDDMSALLGSGIRMTLNSLGITQSLEKALSLDMLTVTNGSLDLNDRNTDVGNNYYNIEMGKYLFNDFMVTAAFGLNHDDNRFGIMYDLGSRFSLSAWTSSDNNFIGALYKYNF
ncbi:translocation/assembly module TamB domain-containing protein, partial [Megasphaera massiliensis]